MTVAISAPKKLFKALEFFDWVHQPENQDKWFELVRGEVIELPPPQKIHGVVTGNSARALGNYTFQRRKGYITTNDSGVILERDPDTVRGPDVALYEDAQKWSELHPKYGEVPPRLAVEVLSPNDKIGRVLQEINDYLNSGVEIVWLVDPELKNVTVFRPKQQQETIQMGQELTGYDVLPDLRVPVADLFWMPEENGK